MKPTRFLQSAGGVSERMAGFTAHLRNNGLSVGQRETETVIRAMRHLKLCDSHSVRLAARSVYSTGPESFKQFDELFDAYWFNTRRSVERFEQQANQQTRQQTRQHQHSPTSRLDPSQASGSQGQAESPDNASDDGQAEQDQQSLDGKLIGSRVTNRQSVDLREFMTPESIADAQRVATRIAASIRDRRSRRWAASRRGSMLDHRRIIRHSLSRGGEPMQLFRRRHPQRPVRLTALVDVSGSMMVYSRVFLAFLKGLISHDAHTDAYLFHTALVKVSDDLREKDTMKAINRLSLKAQGFGGGSRIGHALESFNRHYARQRVNGRTVVLILSDGYDTDPPERLSAALATLKKRGCRIVWLNPLKGWKDYQPIARGMAAALPHLDLFAAANTLDSLAALEKPLVGL